MKEMHYCAYHKTEEPETAFKLKGDKLDSWCIQGRREYNRKYSEVKYAPIKSEVAKKQAERAAAKTKICSECKTEKPLEDFPERSDRPGKRHSRCQPCYVTWRNRKGKESYDRNKQNRVQEARDKRSECLTCNLSKHTKMPTLPGRSLVLTTESYNALWVSMWPYPEYVRHAWPDSWFCQIFRNEGPMLSSKLIKEAVGVTLEYWKYIPQDGLITFIDKTKVQSNNPGYCFLRAGFERVGETQSGLVSLQLSKRKIEEIIPRSIK